MAVSPIEECPDASVVRLRQVAARRSEQDAELVTTAGEVVSATREVLLERKGLVGTELGTTQARTLMAEVKRLAVAEVQVAIGFGITEAQQLVAVATCAGDLLAILVRSMAEGRASWAMVRAFWTRTATLEDEQRLLVAEALFGTDVSLVAPERLDPNDSLHDEPWEHGQFQRALDREATACASADPAAESARRRTAYRRRKASFRAHDDGTGTLTLTGPLVSLFAVWLRLDRAARSLRARGDERTLTQGRHDLAAALLLYATVTLAGKESGAGPSQPAAEDAAKDAGEDAGEELAAGENLEAGPDDEAAPTMPWADEVLAPDDLAQLVRVINAQPLVQLNVVLPYSTLVGGFPMCAGCSSPTDRPSFPVEQEDSVPGENSALREDSAPREDSALGEDPDRRRGGAAEVLGPSPFWITDGHARELAMLPGTELHRFVTDPFDGRLVERTVDSYKPDTDMRRQIIAADLYSRAPGTRTTGAYAGQLDHVVPWGWAGGPTSEVNLALLAIPPHQLKTLGYWKAEIGTRRDMTFTTLLGQVTRSRVHDYRQYLDNRRGRGAAHPVVSTGTGAGGEADTADDGWARRDLASRAIYAGLAAQDEHRFGATRSQREDDRDRLLLTHTDPATGSERTGPPEEPDTVEHLLGIEDGATGDQTPEE